MLFCILLLCAPQQLVNADLSLLAAMQPKIAAESSAVGLRVLIGKKETATPRLDGRLDDPVWTAAAVATDFTQNYPQGGVPATRRTEARCLRWRCDVRRHARLRLSRQHRRPIDASRRNGELGLG